jgi:multidrug resistance efflux pump
METTQESTTNQTNKIPDKAKRKPFVFFALAFFAIVAAVSVYGYWLVTKDRIYTDKAQVFAPEIILAPSNPGTLEEIFVQEGDIIASNAVVARVGNQLIKTKTSGLVVATTEDTGKIINAGESVVTIINPDELRIIAQIDENKGLKNIQAGQRVEFTVDAFGPKRYSGVVDEVSSTSRAQDIVFNISDKRKTAQFDVKIRFNVGNYPELKNGMSAKVWIYTNDK